MAAIHFHWASAVAEIALHSVSKIQGSVFEVEAIYLIGCWFIAEEMNQFSKMHKNLYNVLVVKC